MEDNHLIVGIPRGTISSKRMGELILRYDVPTENMCRTSSDKKYVSNPSPLKVAICKETFYARFYLPLYPFIERLLVRYGLVPTQIHLNA